MRDDLTEFFDESGNYSIEVARQKGLGQGGAICAAWCK
jgi:hypothetical protein